MIRIRTKFGGGWVTTRFISARWVTIGLINDKHTTLYASNLQFAGENHLRLSNALRTAMHIKAIKDSTNPCGEVLLHPDDPPMGSPKIDWGKITCGAAKYEGELPQRDLGIENGDSPY